MKTKIDEKVKRVKRTYRDVDEKKTLTNRLKVIEGQVRGITQMVENDRYCGDVLMQIGAVENSLRSVGVELFHTYMATELKENIKKGKPESIDEVMDLIKKLNL